MNRVWERAVHMMPSPARSRISLGVGIPGGDDQEDGHKGQGGKNGSAEHDDQGAYGEKFTEQSGNAEQQHSPMDGCKGAQLRCPCSHGFF